ncbi:MAG TPA: VIT1/CCC1 transporter family protein [Candidatus Acidoferrales bacterium]|nr:VIT1/CCC1 transporter family protein [Candidatus Acidoferrales bacterium]
MAKWTWRGRILSGKDVAIHTEAAHIPGGGIVRELVFGANDGLVAAFAVASGVNGAGVKSSVILIAGLAELIGGTISMALGAYLSTKSQIEYYRGEMSREEYELDNFPDVEQQEIREIYESKGFKGEILEKIISHITSDRKRWVDIMMNEELGLSLDPSTSPSKSGIATGCAYAFGALMPVLPYVFMQPASGLIASVIITLSVLFAVGAAKTIVTGKNFLRSGLESMAIGGLAAAATFLAGRMFKS